jgi:ribosome biogenesis GTPase / thiamine phosphate phosphatase
MDVQWYRMTLLEALGWNDRLAREFEPFGARGYVAARIASEHKHIYRVLTADGEHLARVSGGLRHRAQAAVEYPAVGDWVALRIRAGDPRPSIRSILTRRSRFSRKVAGDLTQEQVVAANIDTVFLAMGLDANYNLRRIERYLLTGWESGAQPVVLLTKSDLCDELPARVKEVESVASGAPVLVTSARNGSGVELLRPFLGPGETVAILGSSGVGKSTLINSLIGREVQRTAEVMADGARGRHTTTHRELIILPGGGLIIDTPGLREIQLWDVGDSLDTAFRDIDTLAAGCRFRDCRHETEPGCAVRLAVAEGRLEADRLESYVKLRRESVHLAEKQDQLALLEKKRKWKTIAKAIRQIKPERK